MNAGEGTVRARGAIIAVDGPSGAGKSTITRLLAERLGYIHIDTGAMFRAVALAVSRLGLDIADEGKLSELCKGLSISFGRSARGQTVILNGEDISAAIRTPEISLLTSTVSSVKCVRENLLERQRKMGMEGGVVLEGRDIGTVVFPDAEVKFFLTASVAERARRRYLELKEKGEEVTLEDTIAQVARRDEQDERRELAPLRRAPDAITIDSSLLSIEEVLALMEGEIRERLKAEG